jgi:hypothetical protein
MGPEGVKACLNAGVNDLGGTLMNESIIRTAGTDGGADPQRWPSSPPAIHALRNVEPAANRQSYGHTEPVSLRGLLLVG